MGEYYNVVYDNYKKEENEYSRREKVRKKRIECPCSFKDGLTYDEFVNIANYSAKIIKRITQVSIHGTTIYCTVKSKTGLSTWEFNVDFNDWGHITGSYWKWSENFDSDIARIYGHYVSGEIHSILSARGIFLNDFANAVDSNKELETSTGLCSNYKERFLNKLFGRKSEMISVGFDCNELIGEHLYPVISFLKNKGFVNYKAIPIKDVGRDSDKYIYQVEQVVIGESSNFKRGDKFAKNAMIYIMYHEKLEIKFLYSSKEFKRENYLKVGDKLYDMGFSCIYERQIKDLVIGLIKKDGSVDEVVADIGTEEPMKKNKVYKYDTKIVIKYHILNE